jgi:hypothetical protein
MDLFLKKNFNQIKQTLGRAQQAFYRFLDGTGRDAGCLVCFGPKFCRHATSVLVRGWTLMMRQRGHVFHVRGPGW